MAYEAGSEEFHRRLPFHRKEILKGAFEPRLGEGSQDLYNRKQRQLIVKGVPGRFARHPFKADPVGIGLWAFFTMHLTGIVLRPCTRCGH